MPRHNFAPSWTAPMVNPEDRPDEAAESCRRRRIFRENGLELASFSRDASAEPNSEQVGTANIAAEGKRAAQPSRARRGWSGVLSDLLSPSLSDIAQPQAGELTV